MKIRLALFKKKSVKSVHRKSNKNRKIQQPQKRITGYIKNLSATQRKNIVCLVVLSLIGAGLMFSVWYKNRPAPEIPYSTTLSKNIALESRILLAGDVYWGRRMNDWSQQSSMKEKYPFSRLNEFDRESYDAWIANLECPAVPGIKQPIGFVPQLWEFNCDTDYLPEAAKWFDVLSLANNHTQNQKREPGLEATRKALEASNIQHFGNFNAHVKNDVCEVISLPTRVMLDNRQQDAAIPIALCGFDGVYYTVTDTSIAIMQEYAKIMPVIAFPHMGQEYQAISDTVRRDLYRKMIDNGADAVIGNHPHWIQPTEAYKGKLITYSLGNFIFDQQFSEEVMRSAAIDVTMSVARDKVTDDQLRAWTKLSDGCKAFHDTCLAQAKTMGLARLPIRLSYNVVGVDLSQQITKPANLASSTAILERLDWEKTKKQLSN